MKLCLLVKETASSINWFLQKGGLFNPGERQGFRILLYHSVNKAVENDILGIRVTPENFSEQMEFLYRENYNVFSLERLTEIVKKKESLPEKAIAITFDDGYKDVLENAVPILNKFNFAATVFATLDYIEGKKGTGQNYWDTWECLSREDLRRLRNLNIDIGSHSVSHRPLSALRSEAIKREVMDSKQKLEAILGTSIKFFSYPHGSFDNKLKDALKEAGYIAACSSLAGKNNYRTDRFEFKRTEINASDDIRSFKKKLNGYYDWITCFKKK